jgi:hypothetical protein
MDLGKKIREGVLIPKENPVPEREVIKVPDKEPEKVPA